MLIWFFSRSVLPINIHPLSNKYRLTGAYTARALAAMLYRVGLISRSNEEQISFAYKMYAQSGKKSGIQAELFKKTFSRPVYIEFVGCWYGFPRSS
jgi:uncharacterized protein (DUF2235 family)